jgi:DNA-binding beta-propeller fold protein YncE
VYVNIVNRDLIARLDAQAIASLLRGETRETPSLDWSQGAHAQMHLFTLGAGCLEPSSLAVDHSHQRLFAACNNLKMNVLNALTGELVASLPTGPGTDAIGFDPDQGLRYSANGGANGSLTIIRQDVTDSYAVIQNLPTRQRARTLAVNPSTGEVYLVTDLLGVNLAQPGGIGSLHTVPANGSFQVLVVGN